MEEDGGSGGVDVEEELSDSAASFAFDFKIASGTDLSANDSTSTVSKRSPANLVMAKSLVCSFSLAAYAVDSRNLPEDIVNGPIDSL